MTPQLHAVELFSGAGGLSVGLERAGFHVVFANEIETDFAKTFRCNHSDTMMICDDIHAIDFHQVIQGLGIEKVTLVSGGPPCQGFSTVGAKKQQDPRNSLFHEYLRAVSELNPNFVIFENVAGFKNMYQGDAYRTLLEELDAMGYQTKSALLDLSDFGLPQTRKRTIVIGYKRGLNEVHLPLATHETAPFLFGHPKKLTLMDAISDLPPLKANRQAEHYSSPPLNDYQYQLRAHCQTLTEHNSANYGTKMREILSLIPYGGTVNNLPLHLRPKSYFSNTYARLLPDLPSPTITRNFGTPSSSRCIHPYQNRALSTREGARLQGFADNYQFIGSKTSKNLQIGNAVPPVFGEIIAKEIIRSIHTKRSPVHRIADIATPINIAA